MRWIRLQLARIAGGWLVFHLCLLIFVPAALCSTISSSIAIGEQCTCAHGDGQACPMHHPAPKSKSDSSSCSCRGTTDPMTVIGAALIGPAAVLAPSVSLSEPMTAAACVLAFHPAPLESAFVPDSPPPRA